jgi:hypothetical protein
MRFMTWRALSVSPFTTYKYILAGQYRIPPGALTPEAFSFVNGRDSARHVIKRILDPRFLSETASCDVEYVSTIHQSLRLIVSARHVIKRILEPSFLESHGIL